MLLIFAYSLVLPLCVRIFILWRRKASGVKKGLKHFSGLLQDITVALELVLIAALLSPKFNWVYLGVWSLVQLYILFDAFLIYHLHVRMSIRFIPLIAEFKSFKNSAYEYGFGRFLIYGTVMSFISTVFYLFLQNTELNSSLPFISALLGISLLSSCTLAYACGLENTKYFNAFFKLQGELVKKLLKTRFFEQVKKEMSPDILQPQQEKSKPLHPAYPILKYTKGFYGKKQFDMSFSKKPHVIFINIESFRAKDIGCLGGKYPVTPCFDALAKEGVLFKNFYSNATETSKSLLAALFGILPFYDNESKNHLIDIPLVGIGGLLGNEGYHTAHIQGGDIDFDDQQKILLNHQFDVALGKEDLLKRFPEASCTSWGVHDEHLFAYTLQWLDEFTKRDKPIFLSLSTITNHHPWRVVESLDYPVINEEDQYQRFLKSVYYTDFHIGQFIQSLKDRGLYEDCLIFLYGDHGHPMGEHENKLNLSNVFEENVKVPLLILGGANLKEPKVVEDVGSLIDLLPTVMDVLGFKGVNHWMGTSLMRKASQRIAFFINNRVDKYFGCRYGDNKLIISSSEPQGKLYDLSKDPLELHDISTLWREDFAKMGLWINQCVNFMQWLYINQSFTFNPQDSLQLTGNSSSEERLLDSFKARKKVRFLDLSKCFHLGDRDFESISKKCGYLKELNLRECLISDKAFRKILYYARRLEKLSLQGCLFITDRSIETLLKQCTHLKEINLEELPEVSFESLEHLDVRHSEAEKLLLKGSSQLSDKALEAIAKIFPNLKTLSISGHNVTDRGVASCAIRLRSLEELEITHAIHLTDLGLEAICSSPVKRLVIEGATSLTDKSIKVLNHSKIENLTISEGLQFSDKWLKELEMKSLKKLTLKKCPMSTEALASLARISLEKLEIIDCEEIDDKVLSSLKDSIFEELVLAGCHKITDEGILKLKTATVNFLSLSNCPNITVAGMEQLVSHMREKPEAIIDDIKLTFNI